MLNKDNNESKNLAPIRYADDSGNATDAYPFCPNGAALGAAALCSPCGRHLAPRRVRSRQLRRARRRL